MGLSLLRGGAERGQQARHVAVSLVHRVRDLGQELGSPVLADRLQGHIEPLEVPVRPPRADGVQRVGRRDDVRFQTNVGFAERIAAAVGAFVMAQANGRNFRIRR